MIFVNLPVRDLDASEAFYEALGFGSNQYSSDEQTVAMSVDENVVVLLHTRDRFAEIVPGEIGDPAQATTVVNRLTVDGRDEVDELVARALDAGGRPWLPAREGAANYTGSFADPDGHAWEITFLDRLHVIN